MGNNYKKYLIKMKFAIIALVSASAAFKLTHRPSGVTFFATGGDVSIEDLEKEKEENLAIHGYEDVQLRFATGMSGDEDLGQNIIMKGDKYHYNQANLVQTGFATGMNGDEDLGQNIIMKGDKYHYNQANLV